MSRNLTYKLTHKFQPLDSRDYLYTVDNNFRTQTLTIKSTITTKPVTTTVPTTFNLSTMGLVSPILNQGDIGTCVSNAFSLCISSQTKNGVAISRLLHYAMCRCLDDTPLNDDAGTYVRTACKVLQSYGACKENIYPYITTNVYNFPPLTAFRNCYNFGKFTYIFLTQNLATIKTCLITYKVPIVFAIMVYSSFLTNTVATTGVVPMPNTSHETLEGGHCLNIVGFNDTTQVFYVANSWGTGWGMRGYCTIPYAYILNPNLASDFCFTQFTY